MAKRKRIVEINGEEIVVQEEQILKFQKEIEDIVRKDGIPYLDAIQDYCVDNNVEIETVKNLISRNLLSKITEEAMDKNLLKENSNRLPI